MVYKEYDQKTLSKLQNTELEILKDFDALCERYGLQYFGCGGTAIGAVRHKGFIPWDDDIDIGMLRVDYEKFLEIAQREEYLQKYHTINAEGQKIYPMMITRWCKNGTRFKEETMKAIEGDFGIFIDIFCFDNVPDNQFKMKIQAWRAWFWGKLFVLFWINEPVLYLDGILAKIVTSICKFIHILLHLFHVSPRFLYQHAKKIGIAYLNYPTRRVAHLYDPKLYTSMINRDDIVPTVKMEYSGLQISFPKNVEAYLLQRYGSGYMQLPPEDKRHNHPPYELDFGEDVVNE